MSDPADPHTCNYCEEVVGPDHMESVSVIHRWVHERYDRSWASIHELAAELARLRLAPGEDATKGPEEAE